MDSWLGHGPEVAREHYRKVDETWYRGKSPREELEEAKQTIAQLKTENLQLQCELAKLQAERHEKAA